MTRRFAVLLMVAVLQMRTEATTVTEAIAMRMALATIVMTAITQTEMSSQESARMTMAVSAEVFPCLLYA